MYASFGEQAHFFVVYIAEAHSSDGWQVAANERDGVLLRQHQSFAERRDAAALCARRLGLTVPTLVDGMDNAAFEAFAAWPERIYIVDSQGRIHYRGGHGPYDFSPAEARASLAALLGRAREPQVNPDRHG